MKKIENIFIKVPIIMSIITYLLLLINYILNFTFDISLFIESNIRYYIICLGILIYFININNKNKKDLSINILISSFILPMVSSFTYSIYGLIKVGFYTDYLLDICFGIGLLINVIYLNNIFYSKKISNKLLIVSTILILISNLVNVEIGIYAIIRVLFEISYIPYFYNLYEKVKDKEKPKIYLDSQIGLKVIYSIIMLISFVLLFIPAYGYGFGHYYNYFNFNFNIVVILISSLILSLIFIWTNNKKIGFYVSILYPIEMMLFTIIPCFSEENYCINFVGIINICLSILSVKPYFIFSRTEDEKNIEKEGFKMKDENTIYEIDGNMGKILKVYEDRCVISTKAGIKSFALGGLMGATRGDKEFYYSDITSVQFKNLKVTTGYLQFEYAGSHSGNNFTSENSFTFSATIGTTKYNNLKETMPPIYEYILGKVREYKNQKSGTVVQQISSADELAKFKKLLDDGVISQEEFDAKKKQLLGL